ncbi:MAG TPA: hypothetical protein VFY70_07200 [Thermomicrobiales bacterium]|nr:hypothetical protein [Thermomicrobiales bacterium]
MEPVQHTGVNRTETPSVSRRAAVGRLVIGGAAAALLAPGHAAAQDATPAAGECVATAPPLEDGIGFAQLLVGGIIHDMPAGPIEVRISRLAMAPGTTIEASAVPYPALMYMETGTTACPGGPGRIGYGPDGTIIEETTGEGIQYTPAGATQYIPANVPDGAGNEGPGLMSSIIIEFVPVEQTATPTT